MLYRFQYNSNTERDKIIANNTEKILVEEQNITVGNFLVFTTDNDIGSEIDNIKLKLQVTQEAVDFLIMNGGI